MPVVAVGLLQAVGYRPLKVELRSPPQGVSGLQPLLGLQVQPCLSHWT